MNIDSGREGFGMVGMGEGRVRIRLHRLCGATLPMNIVEKVGSAVP